MAGFGGSGLLYRKTVDGRWEAVRNGMQAAPQPAIIHQAHQQHHMLQAGQVINKMNLQSVQKYDDQDIHMILLVNGAHELQVQHTLSDILSRMKISAALYCHERHFYVLKLLEQICQSMLTHPHIVSGSLFHAVNQIAMTAWRLRKTVGVPFSHQLEITMQNVLKMLKERSQPPNTYRQLASRKLQMLEKAINNKNSTSSESLSSPVSTHQTQEVNTIFQVLPEEMLYCIVHTLQDHRDVASLAQVCRKFHNICTSTIVWKKLLVKTFSFNHIHQSISSLPEHEVQLLNAANIDPVLRWKAVYRHCLRTMQIDDRFRFCQRCRMLFWASAEHRIHGNDVRCLPQHLVTLQPDDFAQLFL